VVKIFKAFMASLLIATLAACGGGGGSAGTPVQGGGGATGGGKLSLSLVDATGAASNVLSGTGLTAKATATDANGSPVKNVVVTFTVDSAIATLSPVSGTALTDSNGVAQISLKPGVGTGAGTLTASATVSGTAAVTAKATYTVTAGTVTPSAINFVSAVPSDKSIVIKGAGGNGRTEVALLTFSVVDSANVGLANVKVNFVTQSTYPVTLTSASGVTDAAGKVTVAVNSGTQPTTARVVATVDGTAISSLSDTLTITTGVPVQAAMSLSLTKFWSEGINWDNDLLVAQVLMADAFGGAVADGTQIVFTTDVGAVIGIGGAQCLTNGPNITNHVPFPGFCEVNWRSQNPRLNGIATIVATSTNGSSNLSQSLRFYVLGSYATIYKVSNTSVEGSTTRLSAGGSIGLDFQLSCAPQTLTFEVVDANDNPMPPASTLAITSSSGNVTLGAISPAAVPMWDTARLGIGLAAHRGTVHSVLVTPPATCTAGGANVHSDATFNITVTSPKGGIANTPVTLTYDTP